MSLKSNHILNDYDLIQGSIKQDREIQELLYNRFAPKMYAVCLRYSGNTDDAQDLLQEGFIKVFINLNKFRGDGSFEGWLRRIFVNTSIEHFRRKVHMYGITETQDVTIEDKETNILDTLAEKDIINMIHKLPPGYRTVFNLYVIEGYSHKEIAEMLNINEGTSKSQLARSKLALRKLVENKLNTTANNKIT